MGTSTAVKGNIYIDGSNRHYVTRSYAGQIYQGRLPEDANGQKLDLADLASNLNQNSFKVQILAAIAPIDAFDYQYPNKLQYFSWDKSQPLSEKPKLTLPGQVKPQEYEGGIVSGGSDFIFNHGSYTYIVNLPVVGDSYLTVKNKQKIISKELCHPRNINFKL